MFSSGLFCSGVLGFSVCFLQASFSSVYATVVWHHIWWDLLCSGASNSPREYCFSLWQMEQIPLLWGAALVPPSSVAGPLGHHSPRQGYF